VSDAALVVGLGVSGAAAAEALHAAGAHVRVVEPGHGRTLEARAARLAAQGVEVAREDTDVPALLAGRTLVVPSPIVPPSAPLLRAARDRGLAVWSEPELAWRLSGGRTRLLAVTGTNGKTTTTELLAALLRAPAGGNIGTPLTTLLPGPDAPPLVVAELSSFQLWFTETLAPEVGVVLNLAPDHLDWHGSFVAYAAAKARVWRAQAPDQLAVVNAQDPETLGLVQAHPPPGRVQAFTTAAEADGGAEPPAAAVWVADGTVWARPADGSGPAALLPAADLALAGAHNLANVAAAVTAALAAGAAVESLAAPLAAFRAGGHRLETVARAGGVTWVDDSKATNPHAAAAALRSYPSVVWIAGGLDKGVAFDALAPLLPGRVRAAVTIGTAGPTIAALARGAGVAAIEAGTMDEAVRVAALTARPGDTVLLAPACSSFDQFADYRARGDAFAAAARRHAQTPAAAGSRRPT